jgi:EAL domain-containing protein (putative c-di-GMP-specific phosphodiesterase class I)/GGDEF domain-containing protein/CheY-like chemotaxis protein
MQPLSENASFPSGDSMQAAIDSQPAWRILTVDDDHDFQLALKFTLEDLEILGHPVQLTQVYSRSEALDVLIKSPEFAAILVDVVMETDEAGLQLVKDMREKLGIFSSRIILLTGQPGFAPIDSVMSDYDLSDYCLKSDINRRGIKNILAGALRAYRDISTLNFSKHCLETILKVSNQVAGNANIQEVADILLHQLLLMLSLNEGLILHQNAFKNVIDIGTSASVSQATDAEIIAAVGSLRQVLNKKLSELKDMDTRSALTTILSENIKELASKEGIFFSMYPDLSFDRFVTFIKMKNQLNESERMLVDVYLNTASQSLGTTKLINELSRQAYFDSTISINNRNALLRDIQQVIDQSQSEKSLLMIEVDGVHEIGSTFGSNHAKSMLRMVKERLIERFGSSVTLARVYSDQFFILGNNELVNFETAEGLFNEPIQVEEMSYLLQANYVLLPHVCGLKGQAEDVLRAVTTSMRTASSRGAGTKLVHEHGFEEAAAFRFRLSAGLRHALHHHCELRIEIQPKIDMRTGEIVGGEVLLRWRHHDHDISPVEFIPIAEKSTLIIELGRFVLAETLKVVTVLAAQGTPLRLSLNVSPLELERADFIEGLLQTCKALDVSPAALELEMLESTIVKDLENVSAQLIMFRDAGGHVALDDFGTGMSALSYLHTIPHDSIKIDRSFLTDIAVSPGKQILLASILSAAKALHKEVVIEGVEHIEQRDWLLSQDCVVCQGWLYSPSVSSTTFVDLVKRKAVFHV